ncbi:ADS_G0038710.mRNA.1.CDS.1 [Saccharomyces cerevisiae]|nr:ADS_G0038710.mRNA.1.CDS.1 [Saccharomyces cerevisiae]CAI6821557.1 ADS_G0038710.mRNA.1.CDS.1 [Saccharomyces cerevisiae]
MFPGNSMTAQSLIRLLFFSTTALSISETFQLNELLLITKLGMLSTFSSMLLTAQKRSEQLYWSHSA